MKSIVYLNISQLRHHPDNPRKNIGDVAELAESIQKNGVMQNLTVIPACALDTPEEEQPAAEEVSLEDEFLVLIGNRRMEASKMAGVDILPCRIVSGMDKRKQVSIMLEENMQRNDLTVTEQAEGFQMMLDLGDTVEDIKNKTGFSQSTIYHRLNIAKLDRNVLHEKEQDEGFQMSIGDLQALEKIESIEKRNEVLKNATGSENLRWRVENAVRVEEHEKHIRGIMKKLEEMGISPAPEGAKTNPNYETIRSFYPNQEIPDEIGGLEGAMYYTLYNWIYVIREKTAEELEREKEESPEDIARKQLEPNKRQMDAIVREMKDRQKDLVKKIIFGDIKPAEETPEFHHDIWNCLMELEACVADTEMYGFFTNTPYYQMDEETKKPIGEKIAGLSDIGQQLVLIIESVRTLGDMYDYYGKFREEIARKYRAIHRVFERYGWNVTEEEERLLSGTHELYTSEGDGTDG